MNHKAILDLIEKLPAVELEEIKRCRNSLAAGSELALRRLARFYDQILARKDLDPHLLCLLLEARGHEEISPGKGPLPSEDEKKSAWIQIRITPSLKDALTAAAKAQGQDLGPWLVSLGHEKLAQSGDQDS